MTIKLPELHYHSITAHVPCVTVPLTAIAYGVFLKTGAPFYNITHLCLTIVTFLSFVVVFPTGYLEREKKYINWTPLFKAKLVLSGVHLAALFYQLFIIVTKGLKADGYGTAYAAVSIGVQTIAMLFITYLGVVTAQGRIGGTLSYKDDPENKLSYNIINTVKENQPDPLKEVPYDRL